ncbi:tumor necrosis factor receptor superfamily member 6 isoform X2 [Erinaceus europaeus]|uniref:Tumor necrosis factor receptor superfamily member 6 isoform X2 n=1 Tax=Erinaceus europaeus TaxID=9365 RepID=A0ABM3X008_ERIEU|nr:tumor necrosis factor receptor superfamily member 6 isoform X2 [Erinaceus europaeus]
MPGVWVLRASILAAIAGPLLDGHKAKVTGSSPAKAEPGAKNVTKRSSECLEDPALWGELCCLPCLPGERKVSDCTSYRNRSGCEPCLAGKEYTELRHHALQCRKCRTCDGEHGLEVHRSCVPTQNTKCRCKPNFFCDTSDCEHCTPCSRCEHGIAEDCTPTSNTKCKEGSRAGLWGLLFLLVPIPIVGLLWWRKRRRQSSDFHGVSVPSDMLGTGGLNPEHFSGCATTQLPFSSHSLALSSYFFPAWDQRSFAAKGMDRKYLPT